MPVTLPESCAPTNLRLRPTVQVRYVDSDMYDICQRIKELDDRLFIIDLEEGSSHAYAIMETATDGTEMLVCRVKELDERLLQKLRYYAAVPLDHRIRLFDAEEKRDREKWLEDSMEELYDRMGGPMWHQLEHDGFAQRGVSYAKKGVAQGAKRRAMGI